ncbi:PLP-dependent aminotransferase family protein [Roseiterribacter gracilis]|uniref:GntR family transcriptional regulator n=1 Tax=Roseiterribacter gracilis TaxID=2812848 RepID=A0A8S8XKH8_9PROT|nr:GntR family transcriptional regulator [Rhodospirillales bacterium TMPK1]
MARRRISLPLRQLSDPEADGPPRYERLADELRRLILCGSIGPARQIPSERELAREFAVSRNTVAAAIGLLVQEGLLQRRASSGTYVADPIPSHLLPADMPVARVVQSQSRTAPGGSAATRVLTPCVASTESFPRPRWSRLLGQAASGPFGLMTPPVGGLDATRAAIAAYVSQTRGARCAPEQVVLLSSLRAGFELAARLLLNPGDVAMVEDPCDPALLPPLRAVGARVASIPFERSGIDTSQIAGVRLLVVEPTHQMPTGFSADLHNRVAMLAWAASNNGWIVELDRGSELRHDGRAQASLQALDQSGRVLQLGSFDQTFFGGIGIAYAILPRALAVRFADAACAAGVEPPSLLQAAFASFIDRGHATAHLLRLAPLYRERRAALLEGLRPIEHMFEVGPSDAGLHVTLFARRPIDDFALAAQAARRGLGIAPLSIHCQERPASGLVLGYVGASTIGVHNAVRSLAELLPQAVAA